MPKGIYTEWIRLAAGNYVSGDRRFTIRQLRGSTDWMLQDKMQPNHEFYNFTLTECIREAEKILSENKN